MLPILANSVKLAHVIPICVTDLNGYRTGMYVYTDYGAAAHHKLVFDGQDWRISSVAADTPGPGKTTITIGGTTGLSTDLLNGCELVISRPTSSGDRYITRGWTTRPARRLSSRTPVRPAHRCMRP